MATPPSSGRSSGETKRSGAGAGASLPGVTTRNGARKAKIQTRAMASSKPSAALLAAKKKAQQKKKFSMDTLLRDQYQVAIDAASVVRGPVGLTTEPRMLEHRCLWDGNYPECPERLSSILERCTELGLMSRCLSLPPRAASKEEVLRLHDPEVYDLMLSTHNSTDEEFLEEVSSRYDAVYIHPSSHELSLLAAGSTIDLVTAVAEGRIDCGAALVRPPGHHAMRSEPCGYCFYNNVALAAQHAVEHCGTKRVLIVDWDVHHGQATQQMFYNDPRVVYFSVHRYEHGAFWPNLRQSNYQYTGCGQGTGYNFNVPLNKTKMQDADYLAIWHQLLLPMALEFQPSLVIVSAGYDAALGCPEGEMEVTPACYAHLTHMLRGVCSSVAVVLEGGYCLASLSEGAALTLRQLLGDPTPMLTQTVTSAPSKEITETILNCIYAHRDHWSCFSQQGTYSTDPSVLSIGQEPLFRRRHEVKAQWKGDEARPERFLTRDCYPLQDKAFLQDVQQRLNYLKIVTNLAIPTHRVCYVYDENMLKHRNICEPGHVERPERISSSYSLLTSWQLLERMHKLPGRQASEEEVLLSHSASLLETMRTTETTAPRSLIQQQQHYDSLYLHPDTYLSASTAVGSVLQVVDSVLSGESGAGVCLVRPPGHHASEDLSSGFCIFNNVAVAAKYAIQNHQLKRILIVDWDVHHGNGTQSIFIRDNRVLYLSIHRYDHATFFPHSKDGDHTQVGEGPGEGFNVNIAWNKRGMGDAEYLAAFTQLVLPIAYEYNPELVLVSAGFDACLGDPLGGCKVTPECFGRMTHFLSGLANGRVVLCLEGGYNVTAVSYCMAMCAKALLGDPLTQADNHSTSVHQSAVESINNSIHVQSKYWKSLCFQVALPKEDVLGSNPESRGLVRSNQANSLDSSVTGNDKDQSGLTESPGLNLTDQSDLTDTSNVTESPGMNLTGRSNLTDQSQSFSSSTVDLLTQTMNDLTVNFDDSNVKTDSFTMTYEVVLDADDKKGGEGSKPVAGGSGASNAGASTSGHQKTTQTLTEYLSDNLQSLLNEEMYAVVPLSWCPHVDSPVPESSPETFTQGVCCSTCSHTQENWICLHCHTRACGRYIEGHMVEHCEASGHTLLLSLADLSVWCSVCSAYLDARQATLYQHANNAHIAKFQTPMPPL